MANRSRQLARLAIDLQSLVRKAKVPQGEREIAPVGNAGIVAGIGGPGFRALAVVYGTYTEGFTMPDLVDAAALLKALA